VGVAHVVVVTARTGLRELRGKVRAQHQQLLFLGEVGTVALACAHDLVADLGDAEFVLDDAQHGDERMQAVGFLLPELSVRHRNAVAVE